MAGELESKECLPSMAQVVVSTIIVECGYNNIHRLWDTYNVLRHDSIICNDKNSQVYCDLVNLPIVVTTVDAKKTAEEKSQMGLISAGIV